MIRMMNNADQVTYGIVGTILGSIGVSISVTELQAIISIIVTVLGFTISVLIPLIIKLVKKIKKAKEEMIGIINSSAVKLNSDTDISNLVGIIFENIIYIQKNPRLGIFISGAGNRT